MNGREHSIDRVAHAMTSGAPSETFTARVMSPLCGAPQPGFSERVMARVDARRATPSGTARVLRPLVAAAVAVVMLAVLWLPSDTVLPLAPAPALVVASMDHPAFDTPDSTSIGPAAPALAGIRAAFMASAPAGPVRTAPANNPEPERPLYRIAELEAPVDLAIPAIAPTPPAVAPLERPSALIVPGLRFEKEKP